MFGTARTGDERARGARHCLCALPGPGRLDYPEISAFAGHLVYAHDDPYIHLAIARTLATTGTWGIAPGEFAPASSSPAWTTLLALLWAVGIRGVEVPLWLNVIGALVVLWTARRCLEVLCKPGRPDTLSTVALLVSMVLVVPLPTLAFIGMEHTFQLITVLVASTAIAARLAQHPTSPLVMALSCGLAASVRYEFLLLAAGAVLLLAIRRDWIGAAPGQEARRCLSSPTPCLRRRRGASLFRTRF